MTEEVSKSNVPAIGIQGETYPDLTPEQIIALSENQDELDALEKEVEVTTGVRRYIQILQLARLWKALKGSSPKGSGIIFSKLSMFDPQDRMLFEAVLKDSQKSIETMLAKVLKFHPPENKTVPLKAAVPAGPLPGSSQPLPDNLLPPRRSVPELGPSEVFLPNNVDGCAVAGPQETVPVNRNYYPNAQYTATAAPLTFMNPAALAAPQQPIFSPQYMPNQEPYFPAAEFWMQQLAFMPQGQTEGNAAPIDGASYHAPANAPPNSGSFPPIFPYMPPSMDLGPYGDAMPTIVPLLGGAPPMPVPLFYPPPLHVMAAAYASSSSPVKRKVDDSWDDSRDAQAPPSYSAYPPTTDFIQGNEHITIPYSAYSSPESSTTASSSSALVGAISSLNAPTDFDIRQVFHVCCQWKPPNAVPCNAAVPSWQIYQHIAQVHGVIATDGLMVCQWMAPSESIRCGRRISSKDLNFEKHVLSHHYGGLARCASKKGCVRVFVLEATGENRFACPPCRAGAAEEKAWKASNGKRRRT